MKGWVVLAGLVASSASAQDFLRTVAGTSGDTTLCVTWGRRELTYRVDAAGSARTPGDSEHVAIDAAFASWQAVSRGCSDFTFTRGARVSDAGVGQGTGAENLLAFREVGCREVVPETEPCLSDGSCGNRYRCWDHAAGTIGLTTVTYGTRTGIALDGDIEFNAAEFLFTTVSSPPCAAGVEDPGCVATDVQNTATHEIGHVLGFDHVDDPDSTMAATASPGETAKRVIDLGTAAGFCQTYPRGQPPVPCDEMAQLSRTITGRNTGSFGVNCGADVTAAAPGLALLAAWLVGRRRHRRR